MLDINVNIISFCVPNNHTGLHIIGGSMNSCAMNRWMNECVNNVIWPSLCCHYFGTKIFPSKSDSSHPGHMTAWKRGDEDTEQKDKWESMTCKDKHGKDNVMMSLDLLPTACMSAIFHWVCTKRQQRRNWPVVTYGSRYAASEARWEHTYSVNNVMVLDVLEMPSTMGFWCS